MKSSWRQMTLFSAALVSLWSVLLARIAPAWSADPELRHGWAVTALALWLAWERRACVGPPNGVQPAAARLLGCSAALAAATTAAMIPLLEANPTWPAPAWIAVLSAGACTLALIALSGGTQRAACFAAPVFFIASAVPWPSMVREPLTAFLADASAAIAAEVVSASGHPALVHGRVIEVGSGRLGVDDACSGMRSLQTVTMMAWFFAVLYRLRAVRAARLILAAWGLALGVNLARTITLTWLAATQSAAKADAWHDTAGGAGMLITLLLVTWLGWNQVVEHRQKNAPPKAPQPTGAYGVAATSAALVLSIAIASDLGTRVWYGGEKAGRSGLGWEARAPDTAEAADISEQASKVLGISEGSGWTWSEPGGDRHWRWYVFHWDGEGASTQGAFMHDPTVCLPATGWVRTSDLGSTSVVVHGQELILEGWRFETGPRVARVFFARWDGTTGRSVAPDAHAGGVLALRIRQVMERRRRADLYQILVAVEGDWSDESAKAALQAELHRLLRPLERHKQSEMQGASR